VDFEWDSRKAAQNVAKHGGPFDYATRVFLDPHRLVAEDLRFAYREQRRLTLGKISGRLFAVAFTVRGGVLRLISARKANAREQSRTVEIR
jgi:hypothetical protein